MSPDFNLLIGHVNEKNFVGLATDGDYITCGSENNGLYIYYKGNRSNSIAIAIDLQSVQIIIFSIYSS